jgi:hypothetical protein
MHNSGKLFAFVAVLALAATTQAATVWNEAVDGDLSSDFANPSSVVLSSGINSVYCTFGPPNPPATGPNDQDYLHIHVPAGRKFTGLVLTSYVSDDSTAFVGLEVGSAMTFDADDAFGHAEDMIGFTHFGPGEGNAVQGADILPFLGTFPADLGFSTGFTPPLPSGDYTFWFQQLRGRTTVQFDVIVSNLVPGDFNLDGAVTSADIKAMLVALTDLSKFKTDNGLSDADLLTLGNLNGTNGVTNADIQSLLNLVNGSGSGIAPVPEPASLVMLALAVPALIAARRRQIAR